MSWTRKCYWCDSDVLIGTHEESGNTIEFDIGRVPQGKWSLEIKGEKPVASYSEATTHGFDLHERTCKKLLNKLKISTTPLPGDMFLSRSNSLVGSIIRFGERLRTPSKAAFWNHAGIVINAQGETVEAEGSGVIKGNLSNHDYKVVVPFTGSAADRQQVVDSALSYIGDPYGYLDIVSIAVKLLTGLHLSFHGSRSLICSQLAAKAWEHGGWISPIIDTAAVMPSNLAEWLVPSGIEQEVKKKYALGQILTDGELLRFYLDEKE